MPWTKPPVLNTVWDDSVRGIPLNDETYADLGNQIYGDNLYTDIDFIYQNFPDFSQQASKDDTWV